MRHLIALLLIVPLAASAEVYKWVDEKGVVHYTDKPPAKGAQPAELPPLQTYHGGDIPRTSSSGSRPERSGAPSTGLEIRITSPAPDETVREAQRDVAVSVAVSPELPRGHRLIYYLNGVAQALPTESTSYVISGVQRGSHTIGVSVIDQAGQQVGSASPVTIHMKPPIARR